jgi:membrane protease subunit HflC
MKRNMLFVVCSIIIIVLISLSIFIVDEREFVIITQFGRVVRIIEKPGLYFKLPAFLENINRFDKRVEIFKTQPIQLLLRDKNPIILTSFVCYKISDPLTYFQSLTNKDVAIQRLSDMTISTLGSTLGEYTIENIINTDAVKIKLSEIEEKVISVCNQKAKSKYGIEIISFGIQRINYPTIVLESVYNRMQAERDKEAQRYRAEGMEEFTKIEATAAKEAAQIEAEAYKKAEIIKGEGDKKAIEIYTKAYSKDPKFYEFLKSLDVYNEILKEKTTLILSTESDLLKYLNYKEKDEK